MKFEEGVLFISKAYEVEQDEKLFTRWINGYQTEMTFKAFKDEAMKAGRPVQEKSEEAILERVRRIIDERE